MLRKSNYLDCWRVVTLDCSTLALSVCHLDNPLLTLELALGIVARWNVLDRGRRLNWLDGRAEELRKKGE